MIVRLKGEGEEVRAWRTSYATFALMEWAQMRILLEGMKSWNWRVEMADRRLLVSCGIVWRSGNVSSTSRLVVPTPGYETATTMVPGELVASEDATEVKVRAEPPQKGKNNTVAEEDEARAGM